MKNLLLILLLFPFFLNAQELVYFKLTPNATFVSESNENFVIVPFEGKNAHEIYQILASNVGSTFNDPSKIMTSVQDASIKIRAYSDNIYLKKIGLGMVLVFKGYYQLEFRIKDGRVRVSAPLVEEEIDGPPTTLGNGIGEYSFSKLVNTWFNNGEIKKKEKQNVINLETELNSVINTILGLIGSTKQVEEDW